MTVEYTKSAGLNWEPVYWYFYFWLSEAANKLPATHQIWGGYLWPGPHYGLITRHGRLAPPFHGLGIVQRDAASEGIHEAEGELSIGRVDRDQSYCSNVPSPTEQRGGARYPQSGNGAALRQLRM